MARREDRQFIRFQRTGDADALAAVFDATAPELLRLARHLAAADLADDLVQRTFLDAIEHAERYDASRGVVPWLCGLLANHARRHRRSLRRQLEAARRIEPRGAAGVGDPAALAAAAELDEVVRQEIGRAGAPYAEVLRLHLEEGLGPRAISQRLGRPGGTVRTQLMRGIDKLRRRLAPGAAGALAMPVPPASTLASMRAEVVAAASRRGPTIVTAAVTVSGVLLMKKVAMVVPIAALAVVGVWYGFDVASAPAADAADVPRAESVAVAQAAPEPPTDTSPIERDSVEDTASVGGDLGPLVVRVLDAEGQPRVGQLVTARLGGQRQAVVPTDVTGHARFGDVPDRAIVFSGSARARAVPEQLEPTADGTRLLVLRMSPRLSMRARGIDQDGQPVAGAAIWLHRGAPPMAEALTVSGADGRFTLAGVRSAVLEVRADGYQIGWSELLDGDDGSEQAVTVRLRPGQRRLTGSVLGPNGEAVPGARVRVVMALTRPLRRGDVQGRDFEVELDADQHGRFVAGWLPAGAGHAIATPGLVGEASDLAWAAFAPFDLRELPSVETTLRGTATGAVTVRVFDADGGPLPRASIRVRARWARFAGERPLAASGLTGADGRSVVGGLLATEYRVETTRGSERLREHVRVVAGASTEVEFRLQPVKVFELELLDPAGAPHAHWRVLLRGRSLTTRAVTGTTDAAGIARLEGVDVEARYRLQVFDRRQPALPALQRDDVDVGAGRVTIRIDEADTAPGRIHGRFVAQGGQANGRATLARSGGGAQLTADLTVDGGFEFESIPPGTYRLWFHSQTQLFERRTVTIEPGRTVDAGDLIVERAATATIVCRGVEPGVADQLRVSLASAEHSFHLLQRNDAKTAEWITRAMRPGRYRLRVVGATTAPRYREVELVAGEQRVEFEPPPPATPVTINVRLLDDDSYGVIANGHVKLTGTGLPIEERLFAHFDDFEQKLAILRFGLRPGSYTIEVKGNKQSASREFEVGTEPRDIDLVVR